MSLWKQLLISLLALVIAGGIWVRFFPGAPEMLESWGMHWAAAAVPERTERAAAPGEGGGRDRAGGVVVEPVVAATINDRLAAIGTGRALSSVSVTPFDSGRLTELLVDSGSRVEGGAVIARLDSETEEIAVDRARIALEDATARLERVNQLRSSNTASAVQVTEAELAVSNARLALRDAELTLERRSIAAPISGIVGILPVSVGNYVTSQTEIATIDDRSQIVVDFWAPERFATMISIGQRIEASSIARPGVVFDGEVSAIDNRVDPQSRTLRIQASIANESDALRAGMSFEVTVRFPGETFPAVDPLAIQWGSDGAFVWIIEDGVARRTPVRIIQRNTDSVLVSGSLAEGEAVVTEGIHTVREGAEVRIVQEDEPFPSQTGNGQASGSTGT